MGIVPVGYKSAAKCDRDRWDEYSLGGEIGVLLLLLFRNSVASRSVLDVGTPRVTELKLNSEGAGHGRGRIEQSGELRESVRLVQITAQ